jgi:hypothetical protein
MRQLLAKDLDYCSSGRTLNYIEALLNSSREGSENPWQMVLAFHTGPSLPSSRDLGQR